MHEHGGVSIGVLVAAPFAAALAAYGVGLLLQVRRGRAWPWRRAACWVLGVGAAASGFAGPLAEAAHDGSYPAHMGVHLLVGMVAPLLLVRAAPVTLALRSLDVVPARRLARLLGSPPVRLLTLPIVAAVLDIGGLWLLYSTPLFEASQRDPLLHLLVLVHLLAAGLLFTAAIVPVDPSPHRAGVGHRAVVLVAAMAAHGILAKVLYAAPPPGVGIAEAHAGAQLMFYGGDAVDIALVVLLSAEWFRRTGRGAVRGAGRAPSPARGAAPRARGQATARRTRAAIVSSSAGPTAVRA